MTRTLLALCLAALLPAAVSAQSRVHEKDLTGTWKLVVDLQSEAQNADNPIARIALKAANGLMEEIDVRFEFQAQHRLKVVAKAFGEDADVEYTEWSVNDRGQLTFGDTKNVQAEDSIWMFHDGHLVPYEMQDGRLVRSDNVRIERL